MKTFLLTITIVALTFFLPQHIFCQEGQTCEKIFLLKGKGPNGKYKEVKLPVIQRFNDFPSSAIPLEIEKEWKVRYSKSGFTRVADPSWKYNCAGYVFNRLWHKGEYWFMADVFYDVIIKNFGNKISSIVGFGDVKEGDIVVWFNNNIPTHIAIVNSVDNGKIFIGTKDAQESVYAGILSTDKENPFANCGTPWIYRVNPGSVAVQEITPGWVPDIAIDPDKVQGTTIRNYKIDLISLDKIEISKPNGWKFSIAINGLPKTVDDEIEFELKILGTVTERGNNEDMLRVSFGFSGFEKEKQNWNTFDLGKIALKEHMKNEFVYKLKLPSGATEGGICVSIYDHQGSITLYSWTWKKND